MQRYHKNKREKSDLTKSLFQTTTVVSVLFHWLAKYPDPIEKFQATSVLNTTSPHPLFERKSTKWWLLNKIKESLNDPAEAYTSILKQFLTVQVIRWNYFSWAAPKWKIEISYLSLKVQGKNSKFVKIFGRVKKPKVFRLAGWLGEEQVYLALQSLITNKVLGFK